MPTPALTNSALLRRMLALTWQYRSGCAHVLCLQVALLLLAMTALSTWGWAVDLIRFYAHPHALPPVGPLGIHVPATWSAMQTLTCLAGVVLAIAFARAALTYCHSVGAARLVQQQIVVRLRSDVYARLQQLSFRFYRTNTSGSIIGRITSDVQSVRVFVDGVILQTVVLGLTLIFCLVYMLSIDVGLTLVCLGTSPLLWALAVAFSRSVRPAYDRNRELVDHLLLVLTENIRGVHVVKGFAREQAEIDKFGAANDSVTNQQKWIFWRISLFTPAIETLTTLNMVLLLAYGGWLTIHGRLPLGSGMIVFSGLLSQFSAQVSKFTNIVNSVQQSLTGARRVFEILDTPIDIESCAEPTRLPRTRGHLELRDVSFAYEGGAPVLSDVRLTVEPGQCIAVLGATGQGKTTLLNLIPRFYDPTAGQVLLDGHDLRDIALDDLRRKIGVVFQENFLFSDTVAANIAFGAPDATWEQIETAARRASAHDFIMDLPAGYDTVLREAGKDLSGGQRQRLAIARALLLEPPVLILDDPTAAIDPQTEHEILEAMQEAARDRTTLVVAHRLSTLRRADRVIVLDGGRIVEQGTHEELMQLRGAYWHAAALQTVVATDVLAPALAQRVAA